jgi:hypothetical protein
MAQVNVYSVNAVGYINVTIPPGFSIVTCPLICTPDNTLNTLFPEPTVNGGNSPGPFAGLQVYQFNGVGFNEDQANAYSSGWVNGGTISVTPGSAIFVQNSFYTVAPGLSTGHNMSATFVGTVPQNGSPYLTTTLNPGYNLVGSAVPITGDLYTSTNLLLTNVGSSGPAQGGDEVLFFDPTLSGETQKAFDNTATAYYSGGWTGGPGPNGDPVSTSVSQGFYYLNNTPPGNSPRAETWVENFSVNP